MCILSNVLNYIHCLLLVLPILKLIYKGKVFCSVHYFCISQDCLIIIIPGELLKKYRFLWATEKYWFEIRISIFNRYSHTMDLLHELQLIFQSVWLTSSILTSVHSYWLGPMPYQLLKILNSRQQDRDRYVHLTEEEL